ncbi:MAG: WD40 repeat domain-containing protein [Planctomycetota bacterium]
MHPKGRVLVKGDGESLVFWDLALQRPLGMVKRPFGICRFSAQGDSLYCAREDGSVERLPVDIQLVGNIAEVRVGPSKGVVKIDRLPRSWPHAPWNSQWKRFVLASRTQSFVTVLDRATDRLHKFEFVDDGKWFRGDISSDGRFLATGWHLGGTSVWDALSGQVVWSRKTFEARARFSPDGHTLAIAEPGRCMFFRLADADGRNWKLIYSHGDEVRGTQADDVEFSPDGHLVAVTGKNRKNQVDLLEVSEMRKLATLPRSKNVWSSQLFFTPGGRQLIASSKAQPYDVWNLESIDRQLSEIGVGWRLARETGKSDRAALENITVPLCLTWLD